MKEEHNLEMSSFVQRSKGQKAIDFLMKTGAIFIILEPIWMLLPFAGFLYGSVMHIEYLSRNPSTAWLVHFVFPTHTFFPLGLILIGIGFLVFLVGAFQIYSAKLFKKGLVKNGLYKKFRNPQYIALTLFGIGILLTWGRFITYICFFIMMWLYYYLGKNEERKCQALFGREYEVYRNQTYFLFPGEKVISSIFRKSLLIRAPQWCSVCLSFILVVGLSIGSGFIIQAAKKTIRKHPPAIMGSIELSEDGERIVKLVMVKGPALQAAPFESAHHHYMNKAYEMIVSSKKIKLALYQLGLGEKHTLLAFLKPGSNWYSNAHRDYRTAKIDVFMVVAESPLSSTVEEMFPSGEDKFLKLIKAQGLSYGRLSNGLDPTEGEVIISGPATGVNNASFQTRIEDRIRFFSSGLY